MTNSLAKSPFCFDESDLAKILFPVELRPVLVSFSAATGNNADTTEPTEVPHYQAVVDVERSKVFSIVTQGYEIVTNEQAINLAGECFQTVFRVTDAASMQLFNIIMPKTRSFCHVDFVHSDAEFDFFADDPWSPFIRMTNSYNKTYALGFELGFCRGICKNGLIFRKQSIRFKFNHNRRVATEPSASFQLQAGAFADMERDFLEMLHNLKRFHVPRKYMWPIVCKVLSIPIPDGKSSSKVLDRLRLAETSVKDRTHRYFDEMGENGYAALNVLTDFATRPPSSGLGSKGVHSMQLKCGSWAEEFCRAIQDRGFDYQSYLDEYASLAV